MGLKGLSKQPSNTQLLKAAQMTRLSDVRGESVDRVKSAVGLTLTNTPGAKL